MSIKKQPSSVISKIINEGRFSYPLYKNIEELLAIVNIYMSIFVKLNEEDPIHEQLKSFHLLSEIRMIFESNRIENAGLKFSETQKLINEFFPEIPSNYLTFKELQKQQIEDIIIGRNIEVFIKSIEQKKIPLNQLIPTIQFDNQTRPWVEVARHYLGYLTIEQAVYQFNYLYYAYEFATNIKNKKSTKKGRKDWEASFPELDFDSIQFPSAFTEEFVKEIHRTIAKNLLPKDANVEPGEYRTDDRSAGIETVFVSPKLIPDAMETFINQSNNLIMKLKTPGNANEKPHPVEVAAKISHHLVRIHPFPDFNGRLSRLILVYILRLLQIPFAVSIRGDLREKNRYISALKKADRGDSIHYQAIIAKSIIVSFLDIDSNIKAIGIKLFRDYILEEYGSI